MTKKFLEHLKMREGVKEEVYLDSLGKPTVGVGHLVTKEDVLQVGDKISPEHIEELLRKDAAEAWDAAVAQAYQIGRMDTELIEALASVNFQLGTQWYKIHRKTWAYLLAHDWERAAKEVEDSLWFKQTPVRVRDFQEVLRAL